jgi:hypothetical protein
MKRFTIPGITARSRKGTRAADRRSRPGLEPLESRVVLYTATGNLWPNPQLITISFMPDGTNISGYSNNLNATLNARFGSAAAWQNLFLKAAQSWAVQTNINFAVVPDNGADEGSGNYQQGDPGFGDIRIGGYHFNNPALAVAYAPPPVNNYSIAGDMTFNTGQVFSNGSGNDLFTIAAHEFGHALGLGHSATTGYAEMYATYNGVKPKLNADDFAGIRSIYSGGAARSPDTYDQAGQGDSFDNPVGLNAKISYPTMTYLVTGADITTTDDAGYYLVNAPNETTGTMTVQVQSKGLSLLSPTMTVYANDRTTVLASVSGLNQYGTTLTATVTGVTAGTPYFIKVAGADTSVFSTGAYALALSFSKTAPPIASSPNTTLANGNPLTAGGGIATRFNTATEVDSYSGNTQTDPTNLRSIGMDARGNTVVVWQSQGEEPGLLQGWGIFAQRFDASGKKVGAEFQVNTHTAGDQTGAAVAVAPNGNFIITWTSESQGLLGLGSSLGVFAQRYDSSGNRVGTEFQVNTSTSGDRTGASPVIDSSGNVVIAWSSQNQDGSGWGVFAQRFDPSGNRVGTEFQVNTHTAGDQTNASIAVNKTTGDFVITWASYGQDGSGWGVFAQRFNSSGKKVGAEFQVNTYTAGDQTTPSVAMTPTGSFVITWASYGQDGSGWGVFAQRFDPSGNRVDTEFQVNTYTAGDQKSPSVTMDAVGNFVITWMSQGEAAPGWVVYSRQFYLSGTAADSEVQVSLAIASGDQKYPSAVIDSRGHFAVVWTYPRLALGSISLSGGVFMQAFDTALLADSSDGFESSVPITPPPPPPPVLIPTPMPVPTPTPQPGHTHKPTHTHTHTHKHEHHTHAPVVHGHAHKPAHMVVALEHPRNRPVKWAGVPTQSHGVSPASGSAALAFHRGRTKGEGAR